MPSQAKKVFNYRDPTPLFVKHKIEDHLAQIYSPVVPLRSGGYLVINQTEALVAIDVNSGKATRDELTGSTLTVFNYQIDNGSVQSLVFSPLNGDFDQALNIGKLGIGQHALTLTAVDAAGNQSTLTRNVTLTQLAPFTITQLTPEDGNSDVGVTFRPQIRFSRAVDVSTLSGDSFYATGPDGQKIAATVVPALDGSYAWLFFQNPLPGASRITLHVEGDKIKAAADGLALDGDANGTAGGSLLSSFTTVSIASVPGTRIVGRVVDPGADLEPMTFDDIRRGPDGVIHTADDVFLNPIAHAKVYILGRENQVVYTDANGYFELNDIPVGEVKLAVDGRTATNAPAGNFWPEMVMALQIRPGVTNTAMGSMGTIAEQLANNDRQEVYLPRVSSSSLQTLSNTMATTIGVDAKAAPDLSQEQRDALKLTAMPGTAIGENGQILANAQIGISTVPPELVRDMLPPGVLQHTFDITIQAPGVATFAEPVQITFPNVFNAAPGTRLNILSFDHTTGMLVINGTATVSADGKTVVSDEGAGIRAPGWHGLTPPGVTDNVTPDPNAPAPDSDNDGMPDVVDSDDDNDNVPDDQDNDSEYLIEVNLGANLEFEPPKFEYSAGIVLPSKLLEDIPGVDEVDQPFAWTGEKDLFDTISRPFHILPFIM